ncbi:MAG TPA: hypothetical protein PLW44_04810 [Chitinophagales bacterium]|nr:hypothetical protein [Chitinophagales bacterium]
MTYLIEIDANTEASKKLLSSIRKLQKTDSSIKITQKKEKLRPLTAKEVVLPVGPKPTDEQWDEYLDRKDSRKPSTIQQLRKKLDKRYSKPAK